MQPTSVTHAYRWTTSGPAHTFVAWSRTRSPTRSVRSCARPGAVWTASTAVSRRASRRSSGAGASVAELAASTGWSARRLHRHALRAYGYGPKTLARVLRFRRAVGLARAGRPFADVAAECGFSDQAHLAREVRALSGTTLGALLG